MSKRASLKDQIIGYAATANADEVKATMATMKEVLRQRSPKPTTRAAKRVGQRARQVLDQPTETQAFN